MHFLIKSTYLEAQSAYKDTLSFQVCTFYLKFGEGLVLRYFWPKNAKTVAVNGVQE